MDNYDEAVQIAKIFYASDIISDDLKPLEELPFIFKKFRHRQKVIDMLMTAKHPEWGDVRDFDFLIKFIVSQLRKGNKIPHPDLALFVADVLEGKRKRPTKRGRDERINEKRDYKLARTVEEVAARFTLPRYTNNELSNKTTAAEIVSEVVGVNLDVVITACKKYRRMMVGVK